VHNRAFGVEWWYFAGRGKGYFMIQQINRGFTFLVEALKNVPVFKSIQIILWTVAVAVAEGGEGHTMQSINTNKTVWR